MIIDENDLEKYKIISSNEFEEIATYGDLIQLEMYSKACEEFFKESNQAIYKKIPVDKISSLFPAFVENNEMLRIKYPTYNLKIYTRGSILTSEIPQFIIDVLQKEINAREVSHPSQISLIIKVDENNIKEVPAHSIICLQNDLNSNDILKRLIYDKLRNNGLFVDISQSYFLKTVPIKIKNGYIDTIIPQIGS